MVDENWRRELKVELDAEKSLDARIVDAVRRDDRQEERQRAKKGSSAENSVQTEDLTIDSELDEVDLTSSDFGVDSLPDPIFNYLLAEANKGEGAFGYLQDTEQVFRETMKLVEALRKVQTKERNSSSFQRKFGKIAKQLEIRLFEVPWQDDPAARELMRVTAGVLAHLKHGRTVNKIPLAITEVSESLIGLPQ